MIIFGLINAMMNVIVSVGLGWVFASAWHLEGEYYDTVILFCFALGVLLAINDCRPLYDRYVANDVKIKASYLFLYIVFLISLYTSKFYLQLELIEKLCLKIGVQTGIYATIFLAIKYTYNNWPLYFSEIKVDSIVEFNDGFEKHCGTIKRRDIKTFAIVSEDNILLFKGDIVKDLQYVKSK